MHLKTANLSTLDEDHSTLVVHIYESSKRIPTSTISFLLVKATPTVRYLSNYKCNKRLDKDTINHKGALRVWRNVKSIM